MFQIGDIVIPSTSPDIQAVITGMNRQKLQSYTMSKRVMNGRFVWERETIILYALNGGDYVWSESQMTPTGEYKDIPAPLYMLGDNVRIRTDETTYVVKSIRYKSDGYTYELIANGKPPKHIGEQQIVSADAYTLF